MHSFRHNQAPHSFETRTVPHRSPVHLHGTGRQLQTPVYASEKQCLTHAYVAPQNVDFIVPSPDCAIAKLCHRQNYFHQKTWYSKCVERRSTYQCGKSIAAESLGCLLQMLLKRRSFACIGSNGMTEWPVAAKQRLLSMLAPMSRKIASSLVTPSLLHPFAAVSRTIIPIPLSQEPLLRMLLDTASCC